MSPDGTSAASAADGRADFRPYDEDHDLIEAVRLTHRGQLRVGCPSEATVVLGRGSRAAVELDLEACREDRVPIRRRPGGGCAVVLDPGDVVVSLALPIRGVRHSRRYLEQLSAWLIRGLARVGVTGVERAGICDLVVGDRKVGGACLQRSRDVLYYSASLLVEPQVERMARYLAHPPREPAYRAGRAHRDFVAGLRAAAAAPPALVLAGTLAAALAVPPVDLFAACDK